MSRPLPSAAALGPRLDPAQTGTQTPYSALRCAARKAAISRSLRNRITGTSRPCAIRAASRRGRLTFSKFQMKTSSSQSGCSGQPSGRSGRTRWKRARQITRNRQSQRGRSRTIRASARSSLRSKLSAAKLPSLIQALPVCASATRARKSAVSGVFHPGRQKRTSRCTTGQAAVRAGGQVSTFRCRSSR